MAKPKNIVITENGFSMKFDKVLPHEIRKGHTPHRGGSGIHADKRRKNVRIRGNEAKRAWLDD